MTTKFKPTKEWARKALKATEELIGSYVEGTDSYPCPFCLMSNKYSESIGGNPCSCYYCPWLVFKGGFCSSDFNFGGTPIHQRLPRLYGWRTRFKNILRRKP